MQEGFAVRRDPHPSKNEALGPTSLAPRRSPPRLVGHLNKFGGLCGGRRGLIYDAGPVQLQEYSRFSFGDARAWTYISTKTALSPLGRDQPSRDCRDDGFHGICDAPAANLHPTTIWLRTA
jgi:hypothetical protein